MRYTKIAAIFVLGAIFGGVGGGLGGAWFGYKLGSADTSIDRASTAVVVPVQEIPKAKPKAEPKPEPVAAPVEEAITEVIEEAAEVAETVAEAVEEAVGEMAEEAVEVAAPVEEAAEEVAEAVEEVVEEAAESSAVETFVIDENDESFIEWVGYKSVLGKRLSMKGGFMDFEGAITVVDDAPDESSVELTIDLAELYSENTILTRVLKAEFFFNVDEFPTAHFISSKVEPNGGNEYTVTGNLTMRGNTMGIQFPAVIERRGDKAFAAAEFTIDRSLWGVGFDEWEDFVILNEVVISFEVLADPA